MLKQYFDSEKDQDDTSCDLCFLFVTLSEYVSDLYPKRGKKECDRSDKQHCHRNVRIRQECKCDADCKRIDTRCHREKKHGLYIQGFVQLLLFFL